MTGVEVKSGTFEGDDGNDMTVDGKLYPITIPVANWIRDKKYQPGLNVTFEIKEQNGRRVVVKVYPSKTQPAAPAAKPQPDPELERKLKENGFGAPTSGSAQQGKTEDCTSPKSPAPAPDTGLKTVEGQIIALDVAAHKVTLKDRQGTQHTFIWPPAMHEKMSQLKQWWFAKLTGEHEKEFDIWRLTAQDFFKRPEDWPFGGGSGHGRGGNWQPRNEKIITFQTCYKEACESIRVLGRDWKKIEVKDEDEFNRLMDIALARAKKDAEELCKSAGVQ